MGEYYNNYLAHYGVKGMKWGVRRLSDDERTIRKYERKYGSLSDGKTKMGTSRLERQLGLRGADHLSKKEREPEERAYKAKNKAMRDMDDAYEKYGETSSQGKAAGKAYQKAYNDWVKASEANIELGFKKVQQMDTAMKAKTIRDAQESIRNENMMASIALALVTAPITIPIAKAGAKAAINAVIKR